MAEDQEKVFYQTFGKGQVSLVFVPGLGAPTGKNYWKYQRHFSSSFELVFIDLPGTGKSTHGRKEYKISLFAEDIQTVVDKLGLKKVILIGHSLGSAVILDAEKLLFDKIIGLIDIDGLFARFHFAGTEEKAIQEFLKPLKEDFYTNFLIAVRSMFTDRVKPKDLKIWTEEVKKLDRDSVISMVAELFRWNINAVLPLTRSPIKSIASTKTLQQLGVSVEDYRTKFDPILLNDLGHVMMFEAPESFNDALRQQINKLSMESRI